MPILKTIRVHGGKARSKLPWLILLPLTLTILIWIAYVGNHHRWQTRTTTTQQRITKTTDQLSTKPTTTPTTIDSETLEEQEKEEDIDDLDSDSDYHNTQQQQQEEEEELKSVTQQQQLSPKSVAVVPVSPPRPDLLSFLAHHNAGSDALSCVLGILTPSSSSNSSGGESSTANTTSLRKPTVPMTSPPSKLDLLTALHVNQYLDGGALANKPPAVFFSPEALEVECFKANNNTMCPYPSCPCGTIEDSSAPQCLQQQKGQQQSCYIPLPFVHHSMLHLIRNPVDVVVAGYMKKTEDSVGAMGDETTLQLTLDRAFQPALQSGVPMDALLKLQPENDGHGSSDNSTIKGSKKTYGEVLRELPLEKGVILEFWRAVPAVYAMARQHQILGRLDYVITIKVEEEGEDGGKREFGRRIGEMLKGGGVHSSQVEEAGKQCFDDMMAAQSLVSEGSAEGGGLRGEKWNRAVGALFGEEAVAWKLCELLAMLGYPSSSYNCR